LADVRNVKMLVHQEERQWRDETFWDCSATIPGLKPQIACKTVKSSLYAIGREKSYLNCLRSGFVWEVPTFRESRELARRV
jgi:hypothetical protein